MAYRYTLKTIDINAKEWFDKSAGNSYFSAEIIINYGMKTQEIHKLPFQYGYGNHYEQMACEYLEANKLINPTGTNSLWMYCRTNNIIFRSTKRENCKRKEL